MVTEEMNLNEAEEEEVARLLNSIDRRHVELIALDRKYSAEWYDKKLRELNELEEYFTDVSRVVEILGRDDAMNVADIRRDDVCQLVETMQKMTDTRKGRNDI